jgi:hypothetical protein
MTRGLPFNTPLMRLHHALCFQLPKVKAAVLWTQPNNVWQFTALKCVEFSKKHTNTEVSRRRIFRNCDALTLEMLSIMLTAVVVLSRNLVTDIVLCQKISGMNTNKPSNLVEQNIFVFWRDANQDSIHDSSKFDVLQVFSSKGHWVDPELFLSVVDAQGHRIGGYDPDAEADGEQEKL